MKYLFKRDTIFATISVFLVIGIFFLIPLNMHVLYPVKMALTDFSFNDLSFTPLKQKSENLKDDKIIIVNIGRESRGEIARLIMKLGSYDTKAIGLDVLFLSAKDAAEDSALASAIQRTPNIILSDAIEWENESSYQRNFFHKYAKHSGYINFVGEDRGVIRSFSPKEKWNDKVYLSFASAMAEVAEKDKYNMLSRRDNSLEIINYRRTAEQLFIVEDSDVVNNRFSSSLFRDKTVIIGYVNLDSYNIEDKHFTPMNEKFVGKSVPDMNGAVIHANIISMILDKDYITKTPNWLNWIFAFLFTWFFTSVVIRYYIEKHIWFHLVAKTIQLVLTVAFIYIGIIFTKHLHVSVNFTITLVAIVLAVDILYFYEGMSNWLHKRFGVTTIFTKSHHK